MDIKKFEMGSDYPKFAMNVTLRNTLLEIVMAQLGVGVDQVCILSLEGIAPKSERKEKGYDKLLEHLGNVAQSIADVGVEIGNDTWYLLQATSGVKQDATMLMTTSAPLREYFAQLMTHPSKSTNQLMMGYQLALTPNKGLVTSTLKVLVVEDEFDNYHFESGSISQCIGITDGMPQWATIEEWSEQSIKHYDTRQTIAGVGDCHMKISRSWAEQLAGVVVGYSTLDNQPITFFDSVNQGCQFRLMFNDHATMGKGTFIVSDDVPVGYHMVIPKSALKLGISNLPSFDWEYAITIGSTMPAVQGKARFGSQFARSMNSIVLEARKPVIAEMMSKLNTAGSSIQAAAQFFDAESKAQTTWVEEDEDGNVVEESREDYLWKAVDLLAKGGLEWASADPTIVYQLVTTLAKRKQRLALGMGLEGRVRTALPDDTLPLHVISSVDAPKLQLVDNAWWLGDTQVPFCAVGMVESCGVQYVGMLVVRGKAPIMNHAEQCCAVLVRRRDGLGIGSEFMSHQTASICTMDFDGDRNSTLVWRNELGYLEVINHMVRLQRHAKLQPVTKEKSKVMLSWGELTKLVYASSFEMGCSSITSLYSKASAGKNMAEFKSWLPQIANVTSATQLWLDCQKYAPKDPSELSAIILDAVKHTQGWQSDQRGHVCDSVPYIHRNMITGKKVADVGVVSDCVRYVNSLHVAPELLKTIKPLRHLSGIWGEYSATDKEVATTFRASLKQFSDLVEDEDAKKISAFIQEAKVRATELSSGEFSALWDIYYNHEEIVSVSRDGVKYIPMATMVWILFSERIFSMEVMEKRVKDLMYFKGIDSSGVVGLSFDVLLEFGTELVNFVEKRTTKSYRAVRSQQLDMIVGYVPAYLNAGIYNVRITPYIKKDGTPSTACVNIEILS
jgi:hypothetical protein